MKQLDKFTDHAYALMRIVTGLMFSFHGAQKILGVFSEFQPPVGSQAWFGGIIELFCGLAVMLGFQTRVAAFLSSGTRPGNAIFVPPPPEELLNCMGALEMFLHEKTQTKGLSP